MSVKTGFIGVQNQDLGLDYLTVYDYPILDQYAASGTLWTWGNNQSGQLGTTPTVLLAKLSSPVQTIAGGTNWVQISGGGLAFSGIKNDGTLWLWGFNDSGCLGDGTTVDKSSAVQTIAGGTNWKQVSLAGRQTGSVKTNSTLWTWGRNDFGQLGDNTTLFRSSPVQTIAGGTNWKQICMCGPHTMALKIDGTLWTWGQNTKGALGDNTTVSRSSPVQTIAGGTDWVFVAGGAPGPSYSSSAAIKNNGTLWTWGSNAYGQLATNNNIDQSSPVQTIAGGTNWRQVSMIADGFGTNLNYGWSAGIKTDGTLWTWGRNNFGQLGDNTTISKSSPVQTIAGGTNWKQVVCEQIGGGAVKTDGTLWSWGANNYGNIGNNNITNYSSPVQTVATGVYWKQIASNQGSNAGITY